VRLLLAKTEKLAIALIDVVAYTTGFTLRLAIRLHHDADVFDPHELMRQLHGRSGGTGEEGLRFGVEFADGRKATSLDLRRRPSDEPPEISLRSQGGGGGGGRGWQTGFWVHPLPPPGAITVALAWPARGIAEQTYSVDAAPIIEAAANSTVLWEDNRPVRSGEPAPTPQSGSEQTVLP
jgi:hypothetical protein